MKKPKATEFLHVKPEKLNCAQSILKSYQQVLNLSDEQIAEFRPFGGGRAQGGTCGAVYAADFLLSQQNKTGIQDEFVQITGAITCTDLKKKAKVPCLECVRLADELLEKRLLEDEDNK